MLHLKSIYSLYINGEDLINHLRIIAALMEDITIKAEKVLNYFKDFYDNIS